MFLLIITNPENALYLITVVIILYALYFMVNRMNYKLTGFLVYEALWHVINTFLACYNVYKRNFTVYGDRKSGIKG